jgi:hypothetical protein
MTPAPTAVGVDEADQIRPAGVERARDAELADQQEIIVRRLIPINHAQPLCSLATTFLGRLIRIEERQLNQPHCF